MPYRLLLIILLCGLTACNGGRNSGTSGPSADNSDPASAGPNPVSGVNLAPIANTDSVVVPMNAPSAIDVLANDTDPDGDALKISIVGQPANGFATIDDYGTAVVYDDVIIYQPTPGYSGTDEFSYTLYDGNDGTAGGTVQIRVGKGNCIS